ncbi:MAG: hypothetical protein ACRD4V_02855 [Candidatus Acidiferrales bacterium]
MNYRDIIERSGARFLRIEADSVYFVDPQIGATLSLYIRACTPENIELALHSVREPSPNFEPLVPAEAL